MKEAVNLNTRAANGQGDSDVFPSTHWSVVFAAGRSEAEPQMAGAALAELCRGYWAPLYGFVRSRGHTVHDAQDLTQSFFAYVLEHKVYARANRQKGRFRSFLLASLKNFLADGADRERTLKRGGAQIFLPLHEEQAHVRALLIQERDALRALRRTPAVKLLKRYRRIRMALRQARRRLLGRYKRVKMALNQGAALQGIENIYYWWRGAAANLCRADGSVGDN